MSQDIWPWMRIKDVTIDVPNCDPQQTPDMQFKYVDISSIDNSMFEIVAPKTLLGREAPSRARRPLRDGDVLFSNVRTYLRNIAQVRGLSGTAVASTGFTILRPGPLLDSRFLFHYVRSAAFIDRITQRQTGTHYPATSDRVVRDQLMPLPPVSRQIELARELDFVEKTARTALSNIERALGCLRLFRQSVLASACTGRLTADWRGDAFEDDEIPSTWRVMSIADLAAKMPRAVQSGPFGSNLLHSEFVPTGCLVIGIDNVLDGTFSIGRNHRISKQKFDSLQKYEARPLDVLITVMGTVGRVCTVPTDIEPALITKHVYRITVNRALANPAFIALALRGHPTVRDQIRAQERGQTRPGINGKIVKALELAIPPVAEQEEIVRVVGTLLPQADSIEQRLRLVVNRLGAVSNAVLGSALGNGMNGAAANASAQG
jgi:type I restriction enzyme, S subunit